MLLAEQGAQSVDDLGGAHAVLDDVAERVLQREGVVGARRRLTAEDPDGRLGVHHDGGQRLVDLVGEPAGQLTEGRHALHVSELLPVPPRLFHRLLDALAGQGAGEDIGEQGEPRDQIADPVTFESYRGHREKSVDRVADLERNDRQRPGAHAAQRSQIDDRLGGQILWPRQRDGLTLASSRDDPRQQAAVQDVGKRRDALSGPGVRDPHLVAVLRQLADSSPIHVQILDDASQSILDVPVDLSARPGREHCRELGEQEFGERHRLVAGGVEGGATALGEQRGDEHALQRHQGQAPAM